jgi:stage II sporulation protein D
VALFTTHPDRDGAVLAQAEKQLRELAGRTDLGPPRGIEIRLYPDVETFRNATGEPGWVAAHTAGVHIDLQTAGALRHELLHVLVEAHAAAGLPVWFREGLVEYLEDPGAARAEAKAPAAADLRQTADSGDAAGAITGLVRRYGESAVLGWLASGLPAGVKLE